MPILGFNSNDNMNFDDGDDDKKPLSAVKQEVRLQRSNSASPSKSSSDDSPETPKRTPRAVIARPPTSHGSKKTKTAPSKLSRPMLAFVTVGGGSDGDVSKGPKKGKTPSPKKVSKTATVVTVDDSSDDEVLSNIASPSQIKALAASSPKRNGTKTAVNRSPIAIEKIQPQRNRVATGSFFSPTARREKRFQSFCARLSKLWNEKKGQQPPTRSQLRAYNDFAHMIITTLQKSEIERIPDPSIRADVLKRYESNMDRKKMQTMTEEERAKYLKEKSEAYKKNIHAKQQIAKKRYEDTTLSAQPLPSPKPVSLPEGLAGCDFGDVVMITSFIRAFSGLLTPKEDVRLSPEEFAKALVEPENGYPYVSKVLLILLHTLIHDEEAEFREEMGVKLADLELNSSTVGELARLCLRNRSNDYDGDDESGSKLSYGLGVDENTDGSVLDELCKTDFLNLSPPHKLKLVIALFNRLMDSVALENYQLDVQQQFSDAVLERNAAGQECNKRSRESKGGEESKPASPLAPATIEEGNATEEDDIASKVKRRRLNAESRQKREAEERLIKEKELAEYRMRNRLEVASRKLEEVAALKKAVSRAEPLGTDRNHSRYWYFGKWLPCVFVEKGWCSYDSPSGDHFIGQNRMQNPEEETTFPSRGTNVWFVYEAPEDVESLIKALCARGIRESKLKDRLQLCCNEMKSVKEGSKNASVSLVVKDYMPMKEDFKAKLLQLEDAIRISGLGGIDDFDKWKSALENGNCVAEMGELLIQACKGVRPTMLSGVLALDQGSTKRDSDVQDAEEAKLSSGIQRWIDAIRQCSTYSRLHVLMSMLRSCVRWERSIELSRCKICRRKHDDDVALVCDSCNDIYHTYCLRPPVKKLPDGEWFCLSCKPRKRTCAAKVLNTNVYIDDGGDSDDEADNQSETEEARQKENTEHDGTCVVCGEGEFDDQSDELVVCSECSSSFHLNCHTPPLRHRPRNLWRCGQCVSGRKIRSTRLRSKMQNEVKSGRSTAAKKASLNLDNRDLFDDEASSGGSDSASTGKRRKRSN